MVAGSRVARRIAILKRTLKTLEVEEKKVYVQRDAFIQEIKEAISQASIKANAMVGGEGVAEEEVSWHEVKDALFDHDEEE